MRTRILGSFKTFPGLKGWLETLVVTLGFAVVAFAIGFSGGVLGFCRAPVPVLPLVLRVLVLRVLIVPGLLEELVFRVAPAPRFAGLALVAYVLIHPLNAWLFLPAARPVFYDPVFLLIVALLGACCTLLYRRTRSIWSPTLFHGLAASGWLLFFGGEALLRP